MPEATTIVVSIRFGVISGVVNMWKLQATVVFQVFAMEILKRAKYLRERHVLQEMKALQHINAIFVSCINYITLLFKNQGLIYVSYLKYVSYPHQGCIYLIKNTVKWYCCEIYYNLKKLFYFFIHGKMVYSCNFQHPLLWSSMSHDHSEIK